MFLFPLEDSLINDARSIGDLESASASTLILPGTHFAVNMKQVIFRRRRSKRGLSSLSSEYSLKIGISDRWSVTRSTMVIPLERAYISSWPTRPRGIPALSLCTWIRPMRRNGIRLEKMPLAGCCCFRIKPRP